MTSEKWTGIVVRNTTSETGNVPRSTTSGSPDIILAGKQPYVDPSFLTEEKNYGNAYDNTLYIGWPNYLYVRGKNFTDGDLEGHWNLFYATPNILLYPYLWQENQLSTSSGNMNPPFSIKAGKIGASTDSFKWVPPDTSDHYCMIAVAETPGHPNPLKGVTNITSLTETLANNANIAQRNVRLVRGNTPQVVSKAGYDQGDERSIVDLAVLFKNIPKGSSYTVSSGTLLDGKALSHSAENTLDNDFKYAWLDLDIPANWSTLFTYTLTFGSDWSGIPVGHKPEVTIRGELVQGEQDRLYHHPLAYTPDPDPLTGRARTSKNGGPVKVIVSGSVSTICMDVGP
jgi:hypothetical protein